MQIRSISLALVALAVLSGAPAKATPALVIDAESGRVLHAQDATQSWYPASLTKLLSTYVVLSAIRDGRITLDTPLVYTARAQREPPSKMGFPINTIITVDNALKILMVKSANDLAITLAEGTSGSVEAFVVEMNHTAQALGMTQSRFTNPNGWHDPKQVTTARDMAILARAIYRDFPTYAGLFKIPAVQLGKKIIRGHTGMLGRFDGAEGMKTGFTCPAGFNLVASAKRGQRRLIAVVLGENNAKVRTQHAAELLDKGFGSWTFWRTGQEVETLPAVAGEAPNMRSEICEKKKLTPEEMGEEEEAAPGMVDTSRSPAMSGLTMSYSTDDRPLLAEKPAPYVPVAVFLGPNPSGPKEFIALAAQLAPPPPVADPSAVPMPRPRPAKLKSKPKK